MEILMGWISLLPKDPAWLSTWEWRLWWTFVVLGVFSGLSGYASYVVGRHRGEVEQALLQEQLDFSRKDLATKDRTIEELKKATGEVKALASRDLPRAPGTDLRQTVVDALKNLKRNGQAPSTIIVDRYNEGSSTVRYLLAQLDQLLGEAGIQQQTGVVAGMVGVIPAPPPYQVRFALDAEERARALVVALKPFIMTEPILTRSAGLPTGTVRLTITGQIDFQPDGSVLVR
jgi:hypothetical protein